MKKLSKRDLGELYDRNFERIFRFFYYKTTTTETAEDLTSQTFYTFIEILNQRSDISSPSSFLYGVARNIFFDYLRKKYMTENVILSGDMDRDFQKYMTEYIENRDSCQKNLTNVAKMYIDQLSGPQREILFLRLIEKRTLTEICAILKKDMNYVKTTQKRGIRKLKDLIACTP